jgi:hypothetical protein
VSGAVVDLDIVLGARGTRERRQEVAVIPTAITYGILAADGAASRH